MILAFPAALALAHQCAPGIAPEALLSIVSVESGFDTLAINVNHVGRIRSATAADAIAAANRWIVAGYSVDLGLAQINSRNLGWTSLSLADAFSPCANLAAAATILSAGYDRASREAQGLDAISRTFSLYNSGSTMAGFRNNYVARVWTAAAQVVPQILGDSRLPGAAPVNPPSFVVAPGEQTVLVFK